MAGIARRDERSEPEPPRHLAGRHGWLIFYAPLSFIIFLAAMFAETNRMPFDMPESEQELAGGYNVEYSSMKFALFFMGEYANMTAAAALMVTLFLGGWTLPVAGLDQPAATIWVGLLQIGIFLAKMLLHVVHGHLGALDVAALPL